MRAPGDPKTWPPLSKPGFTLPRRGAASRPAATTTTTTTRPAANGGLGAVLGRLLDNEDVTKPLGNLFKELYRYLQEERRKTELERKILRKKENYRMGYLKSASEGVEDDDSDDE